MVFKLWPQTVRFNYFKAVKGVLDFAVPAIATERGLTTAQVRQEMLKHLKCISDEYRTQKKPQNDFQDPLCRLGYLYCYVAANANLCELAMTVSEDLTEFICNKLRDEEEIKVCAFGGGPGTELLALAKLLVAKRKLFSQSKVTFTLLDEVEEWAETWSLIEREIKSFLREKFGKTSSWPFIVSKSFIPFDVTKTANYGSIKHLFDQDLFILSYVVSEIFEDEQVGGLEKLLDAMAAAAKPGSKFLIIDRSESRVKEMATRLLSELELDLSDVVESKRNMDSDEESSDLGEYLIKDHYPRLKWNSFWVIGTKR